VSSQPVTFVQISDTHFGPTPGYARHGKVALPAVQRLVDTINSLPIAPDFVVHTGDVVTAPDPASYALAAETLGELRVPCYYVCGNHDDPAAIQAALRMGPKQDLITDPETLSYAFEVKGVRFLVFDTHGPADIDPHGILAAAQLAVLRKEAQHTGPPLVIFWHHPILAMDSPWMDSNMLTLNGEEVHQALLPARERIRAVFYGHVHQSLQTLRDGILYVAAGSSFAQFSSWPTDETVGYVPEEMPAYNFVRVWPDRIMIRQHRVSAL
jgi:Icc protein